MKRKQWSQRLRHVVLMCAAAIGLTAFGGIHEWTPAEGGTTYWDDEANWAIGSEDWTDYRIGNNGAQITFRSAVSADDVDAVLVYNGEHTLVAEDASFGLSKPNAPLNFEAPWWYTGNPVLNITSGTYQFGSINLASNADYGGSATLNLNGGTLTASDVTVGADCTIVLNGGTLSATTVGGAGTLSVAGGTFANDAAATISVALTGSGTLTKTGSGTLTFTGDMSGFIGKVAVANGAGSVTLPASAEHARVGDYTAKTTNGDGTFTFSYDASAGAAATASAELLSLDFENETTYTSGWTKNTDMAASWDRLLRPGTENNYYLAYYAHAHGNRRGTTVTYAIGNEEKTLLGASDSYTVELDWFATVGYANDGDTNTSYLRFDDDDNIIFSIDATAVYAGGQNGVDAVVYGYGGSQTTTTLKTASRGSDSSDATKVDFWYHVTLNASSDGVYLTVAKQDGTKKIDALKVSEYVTPTKIASQVLSRSNSDATVGGIDDIVISIPAVAGVDGVNYATFAEAVAAATSTSTITLYSDVALTSSVELPYGATLDLNGYALYTTDSSVDVLFDDRLHCLSSTTAGGFTTFATSVVYMDMVNVWTGEANDNTWATPGNWSKGAAPSSATDVVYIPAGDAISIACADSGDYTGVLTIDRNVTLTGIEKRIRLSTVKGLGTLTLDSTSSSKYFYLTPVDGGDFSIYCDLVIANPVYNEKYDNTYGRKLKVYGKVSGNGNIQHDNKNGTGFAFYDDLSSYSGNYVGGRGGNYTRDETAFDDDARGSALAKWTFGRYADSNKNTYRDPFKVSNVTYEFGQLTSGAGLSMLHATGATIEVGALAGGTSDVTMTLTSSSNTFRKKGATSTANLTLTESVGAVEAEAGTLNLKGTFAPASLTITGADATVTVVSGNTAVPVLADSLKNGYTIVSTAGGGLTTYKAAAKCTITWKVDGLVDEVVQSYVGADVSHADAERNGYEFERWEPAVVSPATGDATYTAIWKTANVTVAKPVVAYGADYTRATVTAAVEVKTPGDVTYELTVTKGATTQTYTGTVSGGTMTFADVEVPREAADIYADITYTVTPKAGTVALTAAATTEAPTTKSAWAFSSRVNDDAVANVGGAWTAGAPTVAENKLAINDATFTAGTKSADDIVVITMEDVIFGDINDAEITGAQAGIRIGESGKFQVLTTNNAWQETSVVANGKTEYDVVVTINYATKKYSVKVGTDTFDNISLAGSETGVNAIEFNGSGSLASLAGEAYDGNMVVDKDGNKYATVDAAIAALKAGTATAPLKMLHDGTAPAGWTIDENGVLTKASIEVESEADKTLVAVPQGCTSIDTLIDLSNRYADDQIQAYDSKTGKFNTWKLSSEKVWTGVGRQDQDDAQPVYPTEADKVLKAGQAVWVLRMTKESKAAPIRLNASYADAPATVALETGWNLVAPTVDVKDLNSLNIVAAATDRIVVPSANGGAPAELKYKNGEWGYNTAEQDESGHWVLKFETEGITIPAGTGFWYVSDSDKNISL